MTASHFVSWGLIQYTLRCCLTSIGIPIVEIRQSYDLLISTVGFPILVRRHFILNKVSGISITRLFIKRNCIEIAYSVATDPPHKSHNASHKYPIMHHFITETCTHFSYKMAHCGIWDWCTGGFVRLVYWKGRIWIIILELTWHSAKHVSYNAKVYSESNWIMTSLLRPEVSYTK